MRIFILLLVLLSLAACSASPSALSSSEVATAPDPTTTPHATATTPPTMAPTASPTAIDLQFDGERALAHAEAQCAIGPRPAGSEALLETRDYIIETLEGEGWEIVRQDGEFMGVPIHNVIAVKGEGSARMVGAHYDTRPVADMDPENPQQPIIGGNDGASGVAALLELARVLEVPEGMQVQLAFFDAEDRGNLDGWPFSVGARQVAEGLGGLPIERPESMVVLDMVGDADLQIFRERNSDIALNDTLFGIADELGFDEDGFYNRERFTIIDDHLPFLEQGIPAVDLIDFDYPYWHTTEDTCDKLSAESLYKVGRVVEVWLEEER
ncbi:MAG: M28 family peptidase [Chloroflexota bacterium]|nr:M28 family peptidase [Chloroflexota bacterium]